MIRYISLAIFFLFISIQTASSEDSVHPFSLHKLGASQDKDNTLLVIGGIQGDEPGGFHAASILATHYQIQKGAVWVVPNLNFPSIIKRSRGIHGDLNRKFASIKEDDPEFVIVEKIKSIILDDNVDMVLNLHDGSGLYRDKYFDSLHGPHRWGQSIIIDQKEIDSPKHNNLNDIAHRVTAAINDNVKDQLYTYRVKNTKTAAGNVEMSKTLTYFAITNKKPAFGVEASKLLSKPERVYYHLLVLESFMKEMGIKYKRNFPLNIAGTTKAMTENRAIALYDNHIFMDMQNVRKRLNYFPIDSSGKVAFSTKDPLIAVVKTSSNYDIYHGNERITTLVPQFFNYTTKPSSILMEVDGNVQKFAMGNIVTVNDSFKILPKIGYRVNAIGFSSPGSSNESDILIKQDDFAKRFSVNKHGNVFRIEFYQVDSVIDKFAGMILIKFGNDVDNEHIASLNLGAQKVNKQDSSLSR